MKPETEYGLLLEMDPQYQRDENQLFSLIDDEVVMLNIENGEYYYLNEVGSNIWKLLENPTNLSQIILSLKELYDVSHVECTKDVLTYLVELTERNLIFRIDEKAG